MKILDQAARFILRNELTAKDHQIEGLRRAVARDEYEFARDRRFDFYVKENIHEWEKISALIKTDAFRSLVYFLNAELEIKMLSINNRDDGHKFWFVQGGKSIVQDLLDFSSIIAKKIAFLMQNQLPQKEKAADAAPSYQ